MSTPRITYPSALKGLVWAILLCVIGANILFPVPIKPLDDTSYVVRDKNGQWLTGFTVEDGRWRIRADLDDIDPRYVQALLAIEDKRFFYHSGVDVPAIIRATRSLVRARRAVSGASTLTMQLVRQIEPRERTFTSKIIESFRALQYELHFSKSEILEYYLTHISFGGNIEGVHAASLAYFGKPPHYLTDAEISLLIAIPQAPEARRPDRHANNALIARNDILARLVEAGVLSETRHAEASEESIISLREPLPVTAWVSAYNLRKKDISKSTLDYALQHQIETYSQDQLKRFDEDTNFALIVVENDTLAVRAHIASADRLRPGGWMNLTTRQRSPGSTLKPFIYGMALDDGLISSGTILQDRPTRFQNYQPENFDRRYHGAVRVHDALKHSLNVPVVSLLDVLGSERFKQSLKNAGLHTSHLGGEETDSGLAIALGGLGVSLNDIAVLYAGLANKGRIRPLIWSEHMLSKTATTQNKNEFTTHTFLSPKTAAELTQILQQAPTPEGHAPRWLSSASPVAYKTGTSYGFRDAWAAGYTDRWTVVVWVGRADGAPRPGETGRRAAAPILFDVLNILPDSDASQALQKDADAPAGLEAFRSPLEEGPQILFPQQGTELLAMSFGPDARGFSLSARSHNGKHTFYVDGQRIQRVNGQNIWRPATPGFYRVSAIDEMGREAIARVHVISVDHLGDTQL